MRNFDLKQFTLDWMGRRDQFNSGSRGTFWPSEASVRITNEWGEQEILGKCHRASYYRLTGVPQTNPPTAKSEVIFLLGRRIEDTMVEIWKQAGIWDNNSVRFEDKDKNISGEYDCVIRNPETGRKVIVELKSTWGFMQEKLLNGYWEGRGAKKRYVKGKPKNENLLQASIYADQTRDKVEGVKLFYVMRDNCSMVEFNVQVDDNGVIYVNGDKEERFTINNVYARYEELRRLVANNQKPEREFTYMPSDEVVELMHSRGQISKTAYEAHTEGKEKYTCWQCGYCPYKDHCLGDNNE